jgi:hypothetical protein
MSRGAARAVDRRACGGEVDGAAAVGEDAQFHRRGFAGLDRRIGRDEPLDLGEEVVDAGRRRAAGDARECAARLACREPAEEDEPLAHGAEVAGERRERKREHGAVIGAVEFRGGLCGAFAELDGAGEGVESRGVIGGKHCGREGRGGARPRLERERKERRAREFPERRARADPKQRAEFATGVGGALGEREGVRREPRRLERGFRRDHRCGREACVRGRCRGRKIARGLGERGDGRKALADVGRAHRGPHGRVEGAVWKRRARALRACVERPVDRVEGGHLPFGRRVQRVARRAEPHPRLVDVRGDLRELPGVRGGATGDLVERSLHLRDEVRLRRVLRVEVERERAEACLAEAVAHDAERSALLGDEEDALAAREALAEEVRDRLALAGAGRSLQDEGRALRRRHDRGDLRAVRRQRQAHGGERRLVVDRARRHERRVAQLRRDRAVEERADDRVVSERLSARAHLLDERQLLERVDAELRDRQDARARHVLHRLPHPREDGADVEAVLVLDERAREAGAEADVEAVRRAQRLDERRVRHGVVCDGAHAEAFRARDALELDRDEDERRAQRFLALFGGVLEEADRDEEGARACLLERGACVAEGLGRALEELVVLEGRAQDAAADLVGDVRRRHVAHGAARLQDERRLVPQRVLEQRDGVVAFREERDAGLVAVVEELVAERQVEESLAPRLEPAFTRRELRLRKRGEAGGLHDLPLVVGCGPRVVTARGPALEAFGHGVEAGDARGADVDDEDGIGRLREPAFAGREGGAETGGRAAEGGRLDHARLAERDAVLEARRAELDRVGEVRVDGGEGDDGVTVAKRDHRPESARLEERCEGHGEVEAVAEAVGEDVGRGADLLAGGLEARLRGDVGDRARRERVVAGFGQALRAFRAAGEIPVERAVACRLLHARGDVAEELGDRGRVRGDERGDRLAGDLRAAPVRRGDDGEPVARGGEGVAVRTDERGDEIDALAFGRAAEEFDGKLEAVGVDGERGARVDRLEAAREEGGVVGGLAVDRDAEERAGDAMARVDLDGVDAGDAVELERSSGGRRGVEPQLGEGQSGGSRGGRDGLGGLLHARLIVHIGHYDGNRNGARHVPCSAWH